MCGIAGFVGTRAFPLLERMTQAIEHRGPDSNGFHVTDDINIGFRRLSIIDLSGGDQPLYSEDRQVVVACNGEIYNHNDLRNSLIAKGHHFKTRSDAEVIVHGYEEYGIDILQRLQGMFFIAIWDEQRKKLFLVRDRMGKKPVHYTTVGGKLYFASEIKCFYEIPDFQPEVSGTSIDDFLTMRYSPGEEIMLKGVNIVPPGHVLEHNNGRTSLHQYWKLEIGHGSSERSEENYIEEFRNLLSDAVNKRLMAEVPLGLYLSGGLDSSSLCALMKANGAEELTAFSHGFNPQDDETRYARQVADTLGAEYNYVPIRTDDLYHLSRVVYHMEMPIANSDIIGFFRLAQEAKSSGLKVILSGEGADELFGSYVHQKTLMKGAKLKAFLPRFLRQVIGKTLAAAPPFMLNPFFAYPGYKLDKASIRKLYDYITAQSLSEEYFSLNSLFTPSEKALLYTPEATRLFGESTSPRQRISEILDAEDSAHIHKRLIQAEYKYWLPTYHLVKEDKISMGHSIELRFPFLDHRLVEFCAQAPPSLLSRGSTTKYMQRQAMQGLLPETIVNRPKGPILVPIDKCFQKVFEEMLKDTFTRKQVNERGLFNYERIQQLIAGRRDNPFLYDRQLFALLSLETWYQVFVDHRAQY